MSVETAGMMSVGVKLISNTVDNGTKIEQRQSDEGNVTDKPSGMSSQQSV